MKIAILTFNYGYAGKVVNGPGMCLANFVKFLNQVIPSIEVEVFTQLTPIKPIPNVHSISNNKLLSKTIKYVDLVHHWSGITPELVRAVIYANQLQKKVIIGPNVLDTVEFEKEKGFLRKVAFEKILTANNRLSFKISKEHNIPINKVISFQVGPDLDLWTPSAERDGTILWKGNSKQFVKDVDFAKRIESKIGNKYTFKFIGYPNPYDYYNHIAEARLSKMTITTSLSETMNLSQLESWSSGIPSVSHPKIYMHGKNYQTGIITNKTIDEYIDAINEIMQNEQLYQYLSLGCRQYILDEFSASKTVEKYLQIISN